MKIPRKNFASSDKPFLRVAFAYPRGLYYHPRYAREVKSDPSGAKATLKKGFPEKTKFSLWISILDDGKEHFHIFGLFSTLFSCFSVVSWKVFL